MQIRRDAQIETTMRLDRRFRAADEMQERDALSSIEAFEGNE